MSIDRSAGICFGGSFGFGENRLDDRRGQRGGGSSRRPAVLAAGADEVSASIAALFGAHAQAYQALSAQAAAVSQPVRSVHEREARRSYASTEAANSPEQTMLQDAA